MRVVVYRLVRPLTLWWLVAGMSLHLFWGVGALTAAASALPPSVLLVALGRWSRRSTAQSAAQSCDLPGAPPPAPPTRAARWGVGAARAVLLSFTVLAMVVVVNVPYYAGALLAWLVTGAEARSGLWLTWGAVTAASCLFELLHVATRSRAAEDVTSRTASDSMNHQA